MKTNIRNTFNVAFYVRRERMTTEGEAPIYAFITLNGEKVKFNTTIKIKEVLWDNGKGKPKLNSSEAKEINQKLEEIRARIFNHYHDFNISGLPFTVNQIKNKFLGIEEKKEIDTKDSITLMELFDYHEKSANNTLSTGTIKHYKVSQRYFQEFIKSEMKQSDIKLQDLSYKFLVDFEMFIYKRNTSKFIAKPCENNTIMRHIVRLRKLINLALKNEWLDRDPFSKFKAKYNPSNRAYLTIEEVRKIENKKIDTLRLQKIRDLFIFSCYTGLAYIDVFGLTSENISIGIDGEMWIKTFRQKTKNAVSVPILPKAYEIIMKYNPKIDYQNTDPLFPIISNQKINAYLKEIADLCSISKELTFHVARHTFATSITLTNGVPIESVSKMLGHSSIKTTQIYAKVIDTKISADMSILRNKLAQQEKQIPTSKLAIR